MEKQYSAPRYMLGCVIGNREYLFTELGEFPSGMAARDKALSLPRSGVWRIFEERDVSIDGLVYGLTSEIVGTPIPASY